MRGLAKAAQKIARVLGAIAGNNTTSASEDTLKYHPHLAFGS